MKLSPRSYKPVYERPKGAKEVDVQHSSEQSILTCRECGEKLILLGHQEDWYSRRAIFIGDCGHKLSLGSSTDEEVLAAS